MTLREIRTFPNEISISVRRNPVDSVRGLFYWIFGPTCIALPRMDITDPHSYLFDPAVIVADWVAFFILFGSAVVIGSRLMQFKGPSEQPEDYFFG